jgi:hypothetical protein
MQQTHNICIFLYTNKTILIKLLYFILNKKYVGNFLFKYWKNGFRLY